MLIFPSNNTRRSFKKAEQNSERLANAEKARAVLQEVIGKYDPRAAASPNFRDPKVPLNRKDEPIKDKKPKDLSRGFKKSVTLGHAYNQPLPMPMRPDGMPDWEAPGLGSFVSFILERGPLKGKVVILKRLENGMYVIAEDKFKSKDDANRDKDKDKLRKENDESDRYYGGRTDPNKELRTPDNYGTMEKRR